jgi:CheY-like chemotaxis protein
LGFEVGGEVGQGLGVGTKEKDGVKPGLVKTRLVLIEDHSDFRESVSMVLTERGYDCVGEFSTMEDALEALRGGLEADLVLSDLGLPGMSGIDGIRQIRELLPLVQVLVLTAFTDKAKVFAALEAGAHEYGQSFNAGTGGFAAFCEGFDAAGGGGSAGAEPAFGDGVYQAVLRQAARAEFAGGGE